MDPDSVGTRCSPRILKCYSVLRASEKTRGAVVIRPAPRAGRIRSRMEAANRAGDSWEGAVLSGDMSPAALGKENSSSDSDMLADATPLSWTDVIPFGRCSVFATMLVPGQRAFECLSCRLTSIPYKKVA